MSTAVTLLTVEEYLQLPEKPGVKQELIQGVVFEMGRGRVRHEWVKSRFAEALAVYLSTNRIGAVLPETTFVLDEESAPQPDVAFVHSERLAKQNLEKQFQGGPDLAIEVVSSETAAQLETKIQLYFRAGAKAVWVAHPERRGVRAYRSDGSARWLEGSQKLEEPDLLPGFGVKAADLFEGI